MPLIQMPLKLTVVTPNPGGVAKVTRLYKAGDPVYALYYGPHRDKHASAVPEQTTTTRGQTCCPGVWSRQSQSIQESTKAKRQTLLLKLKFV